MRTEILIDKNGNFINGIPDLQIAETMVNMLFQNQISLEFYDQIQPNINNTLHIPNRNSLKTNSLSGIISIYIKPTIYTPYYIPLMPESIDISTDCYTQFSGMCETIKVTCNSIVGANYINIVLDRN